MKFSEFKEPLIIETETFSINGKEIKVKTNLSTNDIYDLIMVTLQQSKEDYIYNPFKLDRIFHVNLAMMVTDIEFDAEDRLNKFDTYDYLVSSGIMEKVLLTLDSNTYKHLIETVSSMAIRLEDFENRGTAALIKLIEDLPKNMEKAANIIENFNPEKYQAVKDFAIAANGGRDIVTNKPVQ